jgi:hypothetical protein
MSEKKPACRTAEAETHPACVDADKGYCGRSSEEGAISLVFEDGVVLEEKKN